MSVISLIAIICGTVGSCIFAIHAVAQVLKLLQRNEAHTVSASSLFLQTLCSTTFLFYSWANNLLPIEVASAIALLSNFALIILRFIIPYVQRVGTEHKYKKIKDPTIPELRLLIADPEESDCCTESEDTSFQFEA